VIGCEFVEDPVEVACVAGGEPALVVDAVGDRCARSAVAIGVLAVGIDVGRVVEMFDRGDRPALVETVDEPLDQRRLPRPGGTDDGECFHIGSGGRDVLVPFGGVDNPYACVRATRQQ